MVRAILALLFFGWISGAQAQPVGPPNPILCNQAAITGILGASTVQLAAGVAGQRIFICGYTFEGAGNGTAQLVFGTGATCTTPTVASVDTSTTVASSDIDHLATAFEQSAPGQTLCVVVTGTTAVSVAAYYAQF